MWGRATLAMEVSSTSMKAASATVMAMSQGLTRGFQFAWAERSGLFTVAGRDSALAGLRAPGIADPDGGVGSVESIADNCGLLMACYELYVDGPGKNGAKNCHGIVTDEIPAVKRLCLQINRFASGFFGSLISMTGWATPGRR